MAVIYGLVLKSDLTQVRYVGRTKGKPEKRFLTHKKDAANGSNLPVHRWIRKHENTTFIILEDNLSVEDYVDKETYYIGKLKKDGHELLNCTEAGENGAVATRGLNRRNFQVLRDLLESASPVEVLLIREDKQGGAGEPLLFQK